MKEIVFMLVRSLKKQNKHKGINNDEEFKNSTFSATGILDNIEKDKIIPPNPAQFLSKLIFILVILKLKEFDLTILGMRKIRPKKNLENNTSVGGSVLVANLALNIIRERNT
nr:hypothetical protein [Paraphotobacterium marinum]